MKRQPLKRGPKAKPISAKEIKMAELIKQGYSIKTAMEKAGLVGYPNVFKDRLVKNGLIPEKTKGINESIKRVVNDWQSGMSDSEIAYKHECSRQNIWSIIKRLKDNKIIEEDEYGRRFVNCE